MSIVRSISLCDESYKIAKEKGNLSRWVREALLREKNIMSGIHTGNRKLDENGELCNPLSSNLCGVCWPYGKPKPEDWRFYRNHYKLPDSTQFGEAWILEEARINNPQNSVPETPLKEESSNSKIRKSPERRVGLLRQIYRALW